MPTETLTARRVAAIDPEDGQVDYWDALTPGFALRVSPGGTKTYFVRYRVGRKQKRLTIGRHPILSLANARERARKLLSEVQAGTDPGEAVAERKSARASFDALCSEVIEAKTTRWRGKTLHDIQRVVDRELLPAWGARRAADISRRDVVLLLEKIEKRAPGMAAFALRVVKLLFNAAIDRGFPGVDHNPAARLKPAEQSARTRYLSLSEIKAVWIGLEPESITTRNLLRFAMLTGQRIGSICSMKWGDVDKTDVWHIPASDFKGKREHLVPLSKEAKAILKEMATYTGDSEYVFPGPKGGPRASLNKAYQRVRDRLTIPSWSPHDFRRTFRTWVTRAAKPKDKRDAAGCGVSPLIADAILGHRENTVGAIHYQGDAATYLLSEKREALEKWGKFIGAAVRTTRQ